jgi:hypothetical protein
VFTAFLRRGSSSVRYAGSSSFHDLRDLADAFGFLLPDRPQRLQEPRSVDRELGVGRLDRLDEVVVELVGRLLVTQLVVQDPVEVLGLGPAVARVDERLDLVERDAVDPQPGDERLQPLAVFRGLLGRVREQRLDLVVEVGVGVPVVVVRPRLDHLLQHDPDL